MKKKLNRFSYASKSVLFWKGCITPMSLFIVSFQVLILLLSCSKRNHYLEWENIFSINLGVLRDEVNYFDRDFNTLLPPGDFLMATNGSFYITDPENLKVLHFSNYGEPLDVTYNPRMNLWDESPTDDQDFRPFEWDFIDIGEIEETDKYLFVEDDDPRIEEFGRLILVFDKKGDYQFFIGIDGKGGKSFDAHIRDIQRVQDGISVITRSETEWGLTLFSPEGEVKQSIVLTTNDIPIDFLPIDQESVVVLPEALIPGFDGNVIFFQVSFFEQIKNRDSGNVGRINYISTVIFTFDLHNKEFVSQFEVDSVKESQDEYALWRLADSLEGEKLGFFKYSSQGEISFLVYSNSGKLTESFPLIIPDTEIFSLHISSNGLVSGAFYKKDKIDVVWWRIDEVLGRE